MALVRPGGVPPVPGGAIPPYPHPTMPDPGGPAWRPPAGVDPLAALRAAAGVHPAVAALAAGQPTVGGAAGYTPDNPYGPVQVTPHGVGYSIGMGTHPALQAILGGGTNMFGSSPPPWWPAGRPWPPGRPPIYPGGNPGGPPVAGPPEPPIGPVPFPPHPVLGLLGA